MSIISDALARVITPLPALDLTAFDSTDYEPANDGSSICPTCGSSMYLEISGWTCFACDDRHRQEILHPTTKPVEPEPEDTTDHSLPTGPTAYDDSWRIGYQMGLSGAGAPRVADCTIGCLAWMGRRNGWTAGNQDRIDREWADRVEHENWLDSFARPEDEVDPSELAIGVMTSGHPASE